MKRIISFCLFILILGMGSTTQAQERLTDEQKTLLKAGYEEYREKLNLTDDQATKMHALNKDYINQLAQLKKSNSRRLAKYQQYKATENERNGNAKTILDKDQYKLFLHYQKQLKKEFKKRRKNN